MMQSFGDELSSVEENGWEEDEVSGMFAKNMSLMEYQFETQDDEYSEGSEQDESNGEASDSEAAEPIVEGKGKAREIPEPEQELDQDFE